MDHGGRIDSHQITGFKHLRPHIVDGGVCAVEDPHTSGRPGFGGGCRDEASLMEFAKRLIDRSWRVDQDMLFPFDPIAREAGSVRFFDLIVTIERSIKTSPPTSWVVQNGQIAESTRALTIRERRSVFEGKDGA